MRALSCALLYLAPVAFLGNATTNVSDFQLNTLRDTENRTHEIMFNRRICLYLTCGNFPAKKDVVRLNV